MVLNEQTFHEYLQIPKNKVDELVQERSPSV